eukprot:COSAG06_NODE_10528_length_1664_cov_692.892013_3_plen_108_part_00
MTFVYNTYEISFFDTPKSRKGVCQDRLGTKIGKVETRARRLSINALLSICAGLQRGAEPVPVLRRVRRDRRKGARDRFLIPGTFCSVLQMSLRRVHFVSFCFVLNLV